MMNPIQRFSISGSDLKIPVREVTKYLGYGKQVPVDDSLSLVEKAIDKVREVSEGKGCYSVFEIKADTDTGIVTFPYGQTESHILARHLDGCSEAYLMAVTIGAGFHGVADEAERHAAVVHRRVGCGEGVDIAHGVRTVAQVAVERRDCRCQDDICDRDVPQVVEPSGIITA